jgi:hypothetical protein
MGRRVRGARRLLKYRGRDKALRDELQAWPPGARSHRCASAAPRRMAGYVTRYVGQHAGRLRPVAGPQGAIAEHQAHAAGRLTLLRTPESTTA